MTEAHANYLNFLRLGTTSVVILYNLCKSHELQSRTFIIKKKLFFLFSVTTFEVCYLLVFVLINFLHDALNRRWAIGKLCLHLIFHYNPIHENMTKHKTRLWKPDCSLLFFTFLPPEILRLKVVVLSFNCTRTRTYFKKIIFLFNFQTCMSLMRSVGLKSHYLIFNHACIYDLKRIEFIKRFVPNS